MQRPGESPTDPRTPPVDRVRMGWNSISLTCGRTWLAAPWTSPWPGENRPNGNTKRNDDAEGTGHRCSLRILRTHQAKGE